MPLLNYASKPGLVSQIAPPIFEVVIYRYHPQEPETISSFPYNIGRQTSIWLPSMDFFLAQSWAPENLIFSGLWFFFSHNPMENQWKMAGNLWSATTIGNSDGQGATRFVRQWPCHWRTPWPQVDSRHVTRSLWCSIFVDAGSLLRQPPQVSFFAKKNTAAQKKHTHKYISNAKYILIKELNKTHGRFYNRRKNTSWNHQGVEMESVICCKKTRRQTKKSRESRPIRSTFPVLNQQGTSKQEGLLWLVPSVQCVRIRKKSTPAF